MRFRNTLIDGFLGSKIVKSSVRCWISHPKAQYFFFGNKPLSLLFDELKVVEELVGPGSDLDVVEPPGHGAVLLLDGAVQVEAAALLLATGLEHLGELAALIWKVVGIGDIRELCRGARSRH